MRNEEVAERLDRMAELLEWQGDDRFRVAAYRDAARFLRSDAEDVVERWHAGTLMEVPKVGESIAAKVAEYLQTGHIQALEELESQVPPGAIALMQVPGLGPKRARLLTDKLAIRSISGLIQAAEEHKIRELPGMGDRSEAQILKEAKRLTERTRRLPLFVALPRAEELARALWRCPAVRTVMPAGSLRRFRETIGDIDLLVASKDGPAVFDYLARLPDVQETLSRGPTRATVLTTDAMQVDVRVVAPEEWGAALLYFTGSKAHNIQLRERAITLGYKLNEYGLFRHDDGRRVAGLTEEEVYAALGLAWIPPELREATGEIEAAARDRLPRLVSLDQIQGDMHVHTSWSDGRDSLEAMVQAALRRGYRWVVITDHSVSLGIAHGMDRSRVLAQRTAIARLNRELEPFHIFQGVELEIRGDGTLDYDREFLRGFDWVMASLHVSSHNTDRNTARVLLALSEPSVRGINHPTGRVVESREPYPLDLDAVFRKARELGKALEINGSSRLDLDTTLARRAHDMGIPLTLSSDAHAVTQLEGMRYAVAIARRAWAEPGDVFNTRPAAALLR